MNETTKRDVNKESLQPFAKEVLQLLKDEPSNGARVLALKGDVGAGKTTFTQALGRCLGIREVMTSPTFTLMKSYETNDNTFTTVIHMDAYRIEGEGELRPLQFADMLATPQTLIVVEWPERIAGALPKAALQLTFTIKDEITRTVGLYRT
jgi:tRNA threonylcarbamoyladenosine biosynthesis protein TsaE